MSYVLVLVALLSLWNIPIPLISDFKTLPTAFWGPPSKNSLILHSGSLRAFISSFLILSLFMHESGLEEAQAGIKIAGRNINNLRYADDTTLMEESEEELKSLLRKVKEESEKVGLKLNIQKIKIMTSSPITSWQIDGETMET